MILFLWNILGCKDPHLQDDKQKPTDHHLLTDTAAEWGVIEAFEQRLGDPSKGEEYLKYGDYVGSGIPEEAFDYFFQSSTNYNPLQRTGDSARIPYVFNLFTSPNGQRVVGGINCFGCHTSYLNGEFIIGLGNAFSDYTTDQAAEYTLLNAYIANVYGEDSAEWEAYYRIGLSSTTIGQRILLPFKGVNPAFAIEEAAATHRDPETLKWQEQPTFNLPSSSLASDVPPWWNIRKKNALYYNALGRGDKATLMMQIAIVGLWDTSHASSIRDNFPDVLAYLQSLEPPVYPETINESLRVQGESLFLHNCSRCHGTYGAEESYPNVLISIHEVQTDPTLARRYIDYPEFSNWLQESWFATTDTPAIFIPKAGYVAPPLDGIWASAPYLHNGSIPDLSSFLDSSKRPAYWCRDFADSSYDLQKVGWPYSTAEDEVYQNCYDTRLTSYSNQGHFFADNLSEEERTALLEYLKSL